MDAKEYEGRRDELKRLVIGLRQLRHLQGPDICVELGMTAKQYQELFKPALLTLEQRRAFRKAREKPVAPPAVRRERGGEPKKRRPGETLARRVAAYQNRGNCLVRFTAEDVRAKFGPEPVCYLTGRRIDYEDGSTYELDHFVPWSKGGESSLENLQLCSPVANRMKHNHDFCAFVELCKEVVAHAGTSP